MFRCNNCNDEIEFINIQPEAANGHFQWTHTDGTNVCKLPLTESHMARVAELNPKDVGLWKMVVNSEYGRPVSVLARNIEAVHDQLARPLIPTVENPVEKIVEVLVYIPGVGHSVFTNVPLSIVNEAIAHINDNA